MSMKKYAVDMQLHMAVKALATLQGEINCKIDELIKKAESLQEREKTEYFLEMISNNLEELKTLFEQRDNIDSQIESLKKTEIH